VDTEQVEDIGLVEGIDLDTDLETFAVVQFVLLVFQVPVAPYIRQVKRTKPRNAVHPWLL